MIRISMKIAQLAMLALTVCAASAGAAEGKSSCDSAKVTERTLESRLHISALHWDFGGGSLPSASDSVREGVQGRLLVSFCRWKDWGFAFAADATMPVRTSVTVGQNGFHPQLFITSAGLELQRRWNQDALLHAIAAAGVGSVTAEYEYVRTHNGEDTPEAAGHSSAAYASLSVGAELNVFRYGRMYLLAGERVTGALHTPGISSHAAQGPFLTLLMAMGKFR